MEDFVDSMEKHLAQHNQEVSISKQMPLVLFKQACVNVAKIHSTL